MALYTQAEKRTPVVIGITTGYQTLLSILIHIPIAQFVRLIDNFDPIREPNLSGIFRNLVFSHIDLEYFTDPLRS